MRRCSRRWHRGSLLALLAWSMGCNQQKAVVITVTGIPDSTTELHVLPRVNGGPPADITDRGLMDGQLTLRLTQNPFTLIVNQGTGTLTVDVEAWLGASEVLALGHLEVAPSDGGDLAVTLPLGVWRKEADIPGAVLMAIGGTKKDDIWTVGLATGDSIESARGLAFHGGTGIGWQPVRMADMPQAPGSGLAVSGSGPGEAWFGGYGGTGFCSLSAGCAKVAWSDTTGASYIRSVFPTPRGMLIGAQSGAVLLARQDRSGWQALARTGMDGKLSGLWQVNSVWATSDGSAVWVAGNSRDYQKMISSPATGYLDSNGQWHLTEGLDGSRYSGKEVQTRTFTGIWGSAADDIWAVGVNGLLGQISPICDGKDSKSAGVIRHWNGARWEDGKGNTRWEDCDKPWPFLRQQLMSVWGAGANDVWVIGSHIVLHWNGRTWTQVRTPDTSSLNSIWGTSSNDVWAVAGSSIFHFSP